MKSVMRFVLFVLVTLSGLALTIVPAHAESDGQMLVDIPFDFSMGNTALKAGVYQVDALQSGILVFSSNDSQQRRFTFTVPGESTNHSHQPELVFARYGNETFLSKVFLSDNNDCLDVPRSSREKTFIHKKASGEEVSLLVQPAH
jgi:hypothetical protein